MGGVLAKTVAHFWPQFRPWLDALGDPRDPNRTIYPARCLVWLGLLVFLLKRGSRRQIRFELDSPRGLENLNHLAACRQKRVPHGDTLNYLLGRLPPREPGRKTLAFPVTIVTILIVMSKNEEQPDRVFVSLKTLARMRASPATVKRELALLKGRGMVAFEGPPRSGRYRIIASKQR